MLSHYSPFLSFSREVRREGGEEERERVLINDRFKRA